MGRQELNSAVVTKIIMFNVQMVHYTKLLSFFKEAELENTVHQIVC